MTKTVVYVYGHSRLHCWSFVGIMQSIKHDGRDERAVRNTSLFDPTLTLTRHVLDRGLHTIYLLQLYTLQLYTHKPWLHRSVWRTLSATAKRLVIIRPRRMHAVHKVLPTATDIARSLVCRSVVHVYKPYKTSEPIDMPFGWVTRLGQRYHVTMYYMRVQILHGTGQFLRVVWPKSIISHYCVHRSKKSITASSAVHYPLSSITA